MDAASFPKVRLLIVDDDEDDALIIRRLVRAIPDADFDLDWESSFDSAVNRINDKTHDVYLIDYRLGANTGLELLKIVQPQKRLEPFIMMSGANDRDLLRESMKFAAADFVVKGSFDQDTLSKAIFYALERKQFERQRVEELLELNRSKDEFISIASHQLRTPATGVKQYLGMIKEGFVGDLTDSQQQLLEKAYDSNERQLKIVTDLLKVAQVDAGKVTVKGEVTDMNQLASGVIADLGSVIKQRQQTVNFVPSNAEVKCAIDMATMPLVLENIIENASKYSEETKTIDVELTEDDGQLKIQVSDRGVGIKDEDQPRLFSKFTRLDNALSTKVGGTGLGLYWAQKIVNLHDGKLDYQPRDGGGSIFSIILPLANV